jgi:hypothetical protein
MRKKEEAKVPLPRMALQGLYFWVLGMLIAMSQVLGGDAKSGVASFS